MSNSSSTNSKFRDVFGVRLSVLLPHFLSSWFRVHAAPITHRQWTTVRPSPHSLCHLCTWASRLRKAFLESGTSRYADQRRNWNWHTTSWPSWSLKCNRNKKVWIYFTQSVHVFSCVCIGITFFWFFCQLTFPGCPLALSAVLTQHTDLDIWDIWARRFKLGRVMCERDSSVHNLVLQNLI